MFKEWCSLARHGKSSLCSKESVPPSVSALSVRTQALVAIAVGPVLVLRIVCSFSLSACPTRAHCCGLSPAGQGQDQWASSSLRMRLRWCSAGAANAGWGFSCTLRDAARYGLMLSQHGVNLRGEQAVPAAVVEAIEGGAGNEEAFENAVPTVFQIAGQGLPVANYSYHVSHLEVGPPASCLVPCGNTRAIHPLPSTCSIGGICADPLLGDCEEA